MKDILKIIALNKINLAYIWDKIMCFFLYLRPGRVVNNDNSMVDGSKHCTR